MDFQDETGQIIRDEAGVAIADETAGFSGDGSAEGPRRHRDVLALLMPVKLGQNQATDIALEGARLDDADASAGQLLANIFADRAAELMTDWERLLGIVPVAGATVSERRDACVTKIRARGGLSRAYFIGLSAHMGYTIEIYEEANWHWRVNVLAKPDFLVHFRAGQSSAGDRLLSFGTPALEALIEDLKPAHTYVYFSYA